jgi:CubicO group peptidase (beta-lactamase class C family)
MVALGRRRYPGLPGAETRQKFGDYLKEHVTGPLGMTDTAFYVTPDRKARFTDVYHWDRQQNALVVNVARPDRPGYDDPNRLNQAAADSSDRRTTTPASARCSSTAASSAASAF